MVSIYVNSWQIFGGGHSWSAVAKNGTWLKYYGHLISFPPPREHRKHGGVFLKGTRTRKEKVQVVLNWKTRACCSMLLIHSTTWGFCLLEYFHAHTWAFSSPARKKFPKWLWKYTANRGLELKDLKTKQIHFWRKIEGKIWQEVKTQNGFLLLSSPPLKI